MMFYLQILNMQRQSKITDFCTPTNSLQRFAAPQKRARLGRNVDMQKKFIYIKGDNQVLGERGIYQYQVLPSMHILDNITNLGERMHEIGS